MGGLVISLGDKAGSRYVLIQSSLSVEGEVGGGVWEAEKLESFVEFYYQEF